MLRFERTVVRFIEDAQYRSLATHNEFWIEVD